MVSEQGLVEVMRGMLHDTEANDWFTTRAEILRRLRTDPKFEARWREHQEVLDQAVRTRLESNKHMRDDVPVEVVQTLPGDCSRRVYHQTRCR